MFRIFDGRKAFFQWDLNRKLIVDDISVNEVHFCNRTDDCSLVVEVKNDGQFRVVDVPNILLQENFKINVYAYDGEATKHSASFGVNARSKPADYIYTETEVKNYEEYAERLSALEEEISVVYEQVKDLDVTADIEEYVRAHCETKEAYTYSMANLANEYPVGAGSGAILMLALRKGQDENGWYVECETSLKLAKYQKKSGITNFVNHPFNIALGKNGLMEVSDISNIYEGAIALGSLDNILTYQDIINQFVDGKYITDSKVEFSTRIGGSTTGGEHWISLLGSLKLYAVAEAVVDNASPQFQDAINSASHVLVYYHNNPIYFVVGG